MAMRFSWKLMQRSFSTSPVEIRYTHLPSSATIPPISSTVSPVFSASASDTKQLFKLKKREYIEKYQNHQLDVGSSQVQVAILTEKIRLLAIHLQENKKDKSAFRGFNVCAIYLAVPYLEYLSNFPSSCRP
jgi:ribosomal protein S15